MAGDAATVVLQSIIQKIITPVVDTIVRHLRYLFCFKSNIKSLEAKVEQLGNSKKEVDGFCDHQKRNNIETPPSSARWLREVEKVIEDAKVVEIKTYKLNGCLNLKGRYVVSRKSTKLAVVIQRLQNKLPKEITTNIVLPAGRLPGAAANHSSKDYPTRMQTIEEILKALEDPEISIIGLCGLGGIGKTTMVHEVRARAMEQNLFHEFAMAIVSQNQELFKIQGDLAEMLGLTNLSGEKNVIARADQLHKRLTNGNKILVILDNVWNDIKLKDIGVPFRREQAKCKVIIISREKGVCKDVRIQVEVLAKEEARAMFRETAGEQVQKNNCEQIAVDIADECGGLPIALLTLSRALSNKDEKAWKDTLAKLRGGNLTSIRGMEKQVYQSIKLSYDFLEVEKQEEAKLLLMICCQHKEDAEISVEKLAQYCLSLDLFEDVTGIVGARNRVYTLIELLKSCFLLQAVDVTPGSDVKVHDVVRDVCLLIMSREKEERDRVYMHIMDHSIHRGDKMYNSEVDYPKVKLLLNASLASQNPTVRLLQQMEDPRVLESYPGNGSDFEPITPLSEFQLLANLRMLCLENGYICEGTMQELTMLMKLEILSFFGSRINHLPSGIGKLSNLKLLDLRCHYRENIDQLIPIPRGILPGLIKLEVLYMGNHHLGNHHLGEKSYKYDDVVIEGEAEGILELDSLINLTTLHMFVLNPMALINLKHLQFVKLESFSFASVGLPWWFAMKKNTIWFKGTGINWVLEDKIQSIVRRTLVLAMKDIKDLTDPKIIHQFESLRDLEMENCNELEYIIGDDSDNATHSGGGPCSSNSNGVFKNLKRLKIENMSNLTELCLNGRLPKGSLCKLKRLYLNNLSNIRHLWMCPIDTLCLVNLTALTIIKCLTLKFIFPNSTIVCGEIIEDPSDLPIHFPKLRQVTIESSPVESFYNLDNGNRRGQPLFNPLLVMLPSLVDLAIVSNDSIKSVFDFDGLGAMTMREDAPSLLRELKLIKLSKLPNLEHLCRQVPKGVHIFKNLRKLDVNDCDGLTYLISYSVAHMLVNLQELIVKKCGRMKEVICYMYEEDCGETEKKTVFRSLRSVSLEVMENLSSFCSSDNQVCEFPALERVYIRQCPKLETFYCQIPRVAGSSGMLEKNMSKGKGGGKPTSEGEIMEVSSDLEAQFPKLSYVFLNGTPNLRGFNNINKSTGRLLPLFDSWDNMSSTMEDIEVDGMTMVKQIFVGGIMCDFNEFAGCEWLQNLGALELRSCNVIDSVFDIERQDGRAENTQIFMLPKLKILNLISLSGLSCIFRCQMKDISIPELQAIYVKDCGSLVNVAASNLIKQLWNLRQVSLDFCQSMQAVFDFEGLDVMREDVPSILGALEDITLCMLPKVEHLCWSLPKGIQVFQHLKKLEVEDCGSMAYLIPSSMVHMLIHLQELIVVSCENMKEVVCRVNEEDGCGELEKKIMFHSLRSVQLAFLENLSSFCSSDQLVVEFPALESVSIFDCPQIETIYCQIPRVALSGMLEKNMYKGRGNTTGGGEILKVPSDLEVQFSKLNCVFLHGTPNLRGFTNIDKATSRLLPLCDSLLQDMSSTKEDIKVDGLNMVKQIVVGGTIEDFEQQDVMGENSQVVMLPKLKILELLTLPNLTCIFRYQMKDLSIRELQVIQVEDCSSLVNVAASNMIKQLWNLKVVSLENCKSMTTVFDFEGLDVMRDDVPSILGALEDISLCSLPKVEHVFRSLPKEIHVFQQLKTLKVEDCGSMAYLLPSSILHMLVNLQELIVEECENVKEVCQINEEDGSGRPEKKIVFRSLRSVRLAYSKNLSSFCSSDQLLLEFPSLESVSIIACPHLETFCCRLSKIDCSGLLEENMSKGKGTTTEGEIKKIPSDLVAQFPKLNEVILRGTPNLQGFFYNGYTRINPMKSDLKEDGIIDDDADHAAMEEDMDDVGDKHLLKNDDDTDHAAMEEDVDDVGHKPLSTKNDIDQSAQDSTARVFQFSSHVREDNIVDLSAGNVDAIQVPDQGVDNEYDQCGSEETYTTKLREAHGLEAITHVNVFLDPGLNIDQESVGDFKKDWLVGRPEEKWGKRSGHVTSSEYAELKKIIANQQSYIETLYQYMVARAEKNGDPPPPRPLNFNSPFYDGSSNTLANHSDDDMDDEGNKDQKVMKRI